MVANRLSTIALTLPAQSTRMRSHKAQQHIQVLSDKQHAHPFFLLLVEHIINGHGGADIKSAHRIGGDEHARAQADFPAQQHFLYVAAGEFADSGMVSPGVAMRSFSIILAASSRACLRLSRIPFRSR